MRTARRVELWGPSGVGKSTLLEQAATLRSAESWWWSPAEIDAKIKELALSGIAAGRERRLEFDGFEPHDFVQGCFRIVLHSAMLPSQKMVGLRMLQETCIESMRARALDLPGVAVHDELLIHKSVAMLSYSVDFEADVEWYFQTVSVPDAVIAVSASRGVILERSMARGKEMNTYYGLNPDRLLARVQRCLDMMEIAKPVLKRRGVQVIELDGEGALDDNARRLHEILLDPGAQPVKESVDQEETADQLRHRLRIASRTFQKKSGRHNMKTPDSIYCSFAAGGFHVSDAESQRSASKRLRRFGLDRTAVNGCSALDLGCHCGAMLLELTNLGLESGLGLEFDLEKVELARDIAVFAGMNSLTFREADLDAVDLGTLPQFDIVLALAIERHVNDPGRLFEALGKVTRDLLCFEGNSGTDMQQVEQQLRRNGFSSVVHLGNCDDDSVPANNKRPLALARKLKS